MKIKSNSNDKTYDVTAASICLVACNFLDDNRQESGEILLYKRHGDGADDNHSASFPCGGMEPEETLYQAAARELYEECMPVDQRLTISKEEFVEVLVNQLNRKSGLKSIFFGIESVENQVVGMIGLLVDKHSDLFKDYLSKLGSSQRLEDYADGESVSEGVPIWMATRSDWTEMAKASTYGVYNQAFLYCTYFLNPTLHARLYGGLPHGARLGSVSLEMEGTQLEQDTPSNAVYDVFRPFYREGITDLAPWSPWAEEPTDVNGFYFPTANYEIV